jgi:hypothetical protein
MTVPANFAVFGDGTDVGVGEKDDQFVKRSFVHGDGRASRNSCAHDTHLRTVDYHLVVAGRNLGGSACWTVTPFRLPLAAAACFSTYRLQEYSPNH